jgi:hypothetical protein
VMPTASMLSDVLLGLRSTGGVVVLLLGVILGGALAFAYSQSGNVFTRPSRRRRITLSVVLVFGGTILSLLFVSLIGGTHRKHQRTAEVRRALLLHEQRSLESAGRGAREDVRGLCGARGLRVLETALRHDLTIREIRAAAVQVTSTCDAVESRQYPRDTAPLGGRVDAEKTASR